MAIRAELAWQKTAHDTKVYLVAKQAELRVAGKFFRCLRLTPMVAVAGRQATTFTEPMCVCTAPPMHASKQGHPLPGHADKEIYAPGASDHIVSAWKSL